jgi:hypothetical protein
MQLYHSTSLENAAHIQKEGFKEDDFYGIARGVFFSDRPLDVGDGVARCADVYFEVSVPLGFDLDEFEVIEDGKPDEAYREWLLPAATVNSWERVLMEMSDAPPLRWLDGLVEP